MHLFHTSDYYDDIETHVRVVVLGSPEVGKTTLIQQALKEEFLENYKETIEDTFFCKGDHFLLEITDTSGSYNFPEMIKLAIHSADVFLLVFSVTDWTTFDRLVQIRKQIIDLRGEGVPVIVVGNKADLSEREVEFEIADAITCIDWGCRYHDITSKDRDAVCDVFNDVLKCFPSLYGERIECVSHVHDVPRRKHTKKASKIRSSIQSFFKRFHHT